MPLAAATASLGTQMAAAAGSVDPVGIVVWTAIGAVICSTLPGLCSVFNPASGIPCVALGAVVSPGGKIVATSGAPMGIALAAASLSLDAVGIKKWLNIANCIVGWVGDNASYGPIGLVAFSDGLPHPGPVTGSGKVTFKNELIGPSLADAAGSTDAVGIAKWTAIGAAIIAAIKSSGQIAPGSMQNPGSGGPLVGAGVFS